ncbi:hypothetical protein DSECCO2_277170 [anaerobic digester metagenome]
MLSYCYLLRPGMTLIAFNICVHLIKKYEPGALYPVRSMVAWKKQQKQNCRQLRPEAA